MAFILCGDYLDNPHSPDAFQTLKEVIPDRKLWKLWFLQFLGFESFCEKSGWMWYASICFYLRPWFKWSWPVRLSSPSAHSQFTPFHVHYSKTAQLEICFKSMSNDAFFARNCYIPKWSYIAANATCHSRTKIEFTRTDSQDNFIAITSGTISTKNFTNFLGLGSCSGTEYYIFSNFRW